MLCKHSSLSEIDESYNTVLLKLTYASVAIVAENITSITTAGVTTISISTLLGTVVSS